jgi:hypothetical protein
MSTGDWTKKFVVSSQNLSPMTVSQHDNEEDAKTSAIATCKEHSELFLVNIYKKRNDGRYLLHDRVICEGKE